MRFENQFDVDAPIEEVWAALLDVERVAPTVPGRPGARADRRRRLQGRDQGQGRPDVDDLQRRGRDHRARRGGAPRGDEGAGEGVARPGHRRRRRDDGARGDDGRTRGDGHDRGRSSAARSRRWARACCRTSAAGSSRPSRTTSRRCSRAAPSRPSRSRRPRRRPPRSRRRARRRRTPPRPRRRPRCRGPSVRPRSRQRPSISARSGARWSPTGCATRACSAGCSRSWRSSPSAWPPHAPLT